MISTYMLCGVYKNIKYPSIPTTQFRKWDITISFKIHVCPSMFVYHFLPHKGNHHPESVFFISLFVCLFIYFWLCWSPLQHAAFSLPWLLLLWSTGSRRTGSVVVARGLSSCGARAQLLCSMGNLPRPGLEPVSPALAGGLLTTNHCATREVPILNLVCTIPLPFFTILTCFSLTLKVLFYVACF